MKNFFSILLCATITFLFATCGDETAIRQPDADGIYPIVITTDAFQYILHDGVKREQAAQIGDSLLANYQRIMQHLRVAAMPQITISLWSPDHSDDFYAEMRNRIGQDYPGATGYTPGNKDVCLLWNPSASKASVHEYAHLVSMALKPSISNNPRWLWEAVAQYESKTYNHPATWTPAQRAFPGFAALNQYNSDLPYRWGYFLCSCVIERWGDDAYINMIKTNGNTQSVLGITEDEFGRVAEEYVAGLAGS
jgi:hypothetical protein